MAAQRSKTSAGADEQHRLAEAGYRHVEGTPRPAPLERPRFTVQELRAAVPPHCFERSLLTSSYYTLKDVVTCAALGYAATWIGDESLALPVAARLALWPLYWFLQGSYMTGLWLICHDCGHQAFSASEAVNNAVGLVLHSALLVPYHSWRISHRKHHSNTGSFEHDEVFVPATRSQVAASWRAGVEDSPLYQLYRVVLALAAGWLGYLLLNISGPAKYRGKPRSHLNPYAALFSPRERWLVVLSDAFLALALAALAALAHALGPAVAAKLYGLPYLVVNAYVILITTAQHTDTYVPHLRAGEWTWLRGALCTVDRSLGGFLDHVTHYTMRIHVCHHIFSKMPFYHCLEATEAIKPILGRFYLEDATPVPLVLWRAFRHCKFVEDDGDVLFYQSKM